MMILGNGRIPRNDETTFPPLAKGGLGGVGWAVRGALFAREKTLGANGGAGTTPPNPPFAKGGKCARSWRWPIQRGLIVIGLLAAPAFVLAADPPSAKTAAPTPARGTSVEDRVKELEGKKDELWRELEPAFRRRMSLVPADIENMIVDAFYADSRVSALQSDLDWLVRERARVERATARRPSDRSRALVVDEIRKIQKQKDALWRTFEPRQRRRFTLVPADIENMIADAFQSEPRVATIQAELDRLQPRRPKRSDTPPPPPVPATAPPPPKPPLSDSPLRKETDAEPDAEAEGRPGPSSGRADQP